MKLLVFSVFLLTSCATVDNIVLGSKVTVPQWEMYCKENIDIECKKKYDNALKK